MIRTRPLLGLARTLLGALALSCIGATACAAPCPSFDNGTKLGNVADKKLDEISGVVASRQNEDLLWVHNDSGDDAKVYAIDRSGALRLTVELTGVEADDWEDLALGPGPDGTANFLYLGDIGDNGQDRESIVVHTFAEPVTAVGGADDPAELALKTVQTLEMTYPDGAHNAETLLIDPLDGTLYVVTKEEIGAVSLYRYPPPLRPGERVALERLMEIPRTDENFAFQGTPTAGDISADGRRIVLRLYHQVWCWEREPGQALADALASDPCVVSQRPEEQGEAIALDPDGKGYLTISEGKRPPIWRFREKTEE